MHLSSHTCGAMPAKRAAASDGGRGALRINGFLHVLQHQPAELYGEYTTIEYQMAANNVMPPAYVFIVDTSVAEDELRACVASLSQALTTLPEYTQVSFAACFLCLLQQRSKIGVRKDCKFLSLRMSLQDLMPMLVTPNQRGSLPDLYGVPDSWKAGSEGHADIARIQQHI